MPQEPAAFFITVIARITQREDKCRGEKRLQQKVHSIQLVRAAKTTRRFRDFGLLAAWKVSAAAVNRSTTQHVANSSVT